MKSFLLLSFLFYLKASIISDTRLNNNKSDFTLEEQSDIFNSNGDKEIKLIQTIIVTKGFTDCLKRTKIIPKTIINSIEAQKKIIVTKDFEYIVDSQYNNRDKINDSINFCINKSGGITTTKSEEIEIDMQCNMMELEQSIKANYPNQYQIRGISTTLSRSGAITEMETYGNLISYVYNLLSKSEETHDYKIYDILFDTNCQEKFDIKISKEEYEKRKNNNTFFEE